MLTVRKALCSAGHCRKFRAEKDTGARLKCQILILFEQASEVQTQELIH